MCHNRYEDILPSLYVYRFDLKCPYWVYDSIKCYNKGIHFSATVTFWLGFCALPTRHSLSKGSIHFSAASKSLLSGNKCTPDCDFVALYAEKLFLVFCAPGHRKCDTCRQTKICNITIYTREGLFKYMHTQWDDSRSFIYGRPYLKTSRRQKCHFPDHLGHVSGSKKHWGLNDCGLNVSNWHRNQLYSIQWRLSVAEMFNSYSSARSREVRAHVGRRGGDKEPERIIIGHHC